MSSNAREVVIFGTGDVAELAEFYLSNDSPYSVVAFCADEALIKQSQLRGLPVVPFERVLETHTPDRFDMFVALSYRNLNAVRAEKYAEAKAKGYDLISYVSTRSVAWGDTAIGDNCFIFENQTIQPFVRIGDNVTIWSGNHIGHHSMIGDHCFITSHVVISGHVEIGAYSFLGVNATLRDGITLAPRTVVGAGATVLKDTIENGVYVGQAARLRSQSGETLDYFTKTRYEEQDR